MLFAIDGGMAQIMRHELKANASTVHWGYFSKMVPPALKIKSGDEVVVEMVSVSFSGKIFVLFISTHLLITRPDPIGRSKAPVAQRA